MRTLCHDFVMLRTCAEEENHEMLAGKKLLTKYKGNKVVSEKELTFEHNKATGSPNGKFLLCYDYENNIYLMDTEAFKKVKLVLPQTEVYSVAWSDKSDKLAIVQEHDKLQDTDLISLFNVN